MSGKSTATSGGGKARHKPTKPYKDFPLFPHATGRWAKKIRGKLHYFGKWDDPQAALDKYLEQKDDLHAGRTPRVASDALTLRDLVNRFLTAKQRLVDSGDIVERTFRDYHDVCGRTIQFFEATRLVDDLAAEDFEQLRAEIAKTRGPVALGNDISRVRILFKWGFDSGLIDKPIRYGQGFNKPSKKVLRTARAKRGPLMFEGGQVQSMIEKASIPLRAMILLGVNCGYGNSDCALLPVSGLDLAGGWADYPRPKTGIERRCPLWPETITALSDAIAQRPNSKVEGGDELVFVTSWGKSWAKNQADNPISKEMAKLLKRLDIHRPGLNFYSLRRTFETIAGGSRDQVAVDHIMGHAPPSSDMASVYRQKIEDSRLQAVVNHVHSWLFAGGDSANEGQSEPRPLRVVG